MRMTFIIIVMSVTQIFAANTYSQNTRLSVNLKNVATKTVLSQIEDKSKFYFIYDATVVDVERKISIESENELITFILDKLFEGTNIIYKINDRQIALTTESISSVIQQQKSISGKVTDSSGGPLPGVSVVVKGTTTGVITDMDGKYTLAKVPENATLKFSFVGMKTQDVAVNGKININVILLEETVGIEEVVAIGYGTVKKVNLTGSVESIDGTLLASQPIAQTSQALTGLAPGLTAIQSSGQPGDDNATLRIRGVGSISASNDPLVLIDGVEGDINSVDANDIENISVLKDAASAAIYGSRASNGVLLVTTKRAKNNKMSVNYRNYFGWQKPTDLPKFVGALDYLKYSGATQSVIDNYTTNMKTNPDLYPDTDWVNLLFSESGLQQYHNLSVNGGSEKIKSIASLSYVNQGGNIVNYNFERYNGRFNSDLKFSEKFDVNFDLSFNKSIAKAPYDNLTSIVYNAFSIPPIYVARYSDGTWGDGFSGGQPISIVNDGGYSNTYSNYFRGVLRANLNPIPGLRFSVMYSPEYSDVYKKAFAKTFKQITDWNTKTTRTINYPNSFSQTNNRAFTNNFNALISYSKIFGSHNLSALVGYEFIKDQFETFSAARDYYILQEYEVLNAGSQEYDSNSGYATHSGLASYFGRLNYSYKDRYLIEADIRRDASSRFSSSNRVGIFPSFSAGWRLSEEKFIKDMNLFSNLKVRASWGQLGNQQIGSDFPYTSAISLGASNYVFGNAIVTGASQTVLANKDIKWETTETSNVGLDAGLFSQKLSLSFDYYVRKTKDILLNIPIPIVIGLSAPIQNAGNVENKGFDFSINWQDRIGDFSYGTKIIFSNVKNEVTNLANAGPIISGDSYTAVGNPIGMIYGYETVGIFQDQTSISSAPTQFGVLKPGNLRYKDQLTVDTNNDGIPDQGDGKINSNDRVALGNPFPIMTYGIDLNAAYKGFDLSVSLQGVGKRDVLLGGKLIWPLFNAGKIQEWHVKECWSSENVDAKFPILAASSFGSNDIQTSSTWVFNAAYLRVRNLTVGYTIPQRLLKKIFINDLRFYFSCQNLFTFDKLPDGIDPLVPNGNSGAIYPVTASYTFGIDLKF